MLACTSPRPPDGEAAEKLKTGAAPLGKARHGGDVPAAWPGPFPTLQDTTTTSRTLAQGGGLGMEIQSWSRVWSLA